MDYPLFISNPSHVWSLEKFVTLYPIPDLITMQAVYLYDLTREIGMLEKEANNYARLANKTCSRMQKAVLGSEACSFSLYRSTVSSPVPKLSYSIPTNLQDIENWEFITSNNNKIYNSKDILGVRTLVKNIRAEVQYVVQKATSLLGLDSDSKVNVQGAFVRHAGMKGREYIMDLEITKNGHVSEKRVYLLFPLNPDPIILDNTEHEVSSKVIEFVVPLNNVDTRLNEFLKMYTDLCLKTSEKCGLNLVVYGKQDTVKSSVEELKRRYPTMKLNVIYNSGKFSRGRALDAGIKQLSSSDLIFICDVDMMIERSFLRHCRRNTIQGSRVYYPEFFRYYDMKYVYKFSTMPKTRSISRREGHWDIYSFGMLCIYKSDFAITDGYDLKIEGWGKEDVLLVKDVMKHKLDVFRAPDPFLTHRFHEKTCSKTLPRDQFAQCQGSKSEDVADKKQLAEYVFYLEKRCKLPIVHNFFQNYLMKMVRI